MRGAVPGLGTPYPISTLLPAVYQEDPFTVRFTAAFDDVLAPAVSTVDCLEAYVDPWLAPDDFLEWLAGWVGIVLDENAPEDRQRAAVAAAVELYRMRGTITGMRAHVALVTGGEVDIADNGGVAWSQTPGGQLPGEEAPRMAVRVRVADPEAVQTSLVDSVVAAGKPAQVVHRVEVVRS